MLTSPERRDEMLKAFIVNWIINYTGINDQKVVDVGWADNPYRWHAVCGRCPISRPQMGPRMAFRTVDMTYLFTAHDNTLVPERYAVLVGQCQSCNNVYFARRKI